MNQLSIFFTILLNVSLCKNISKNPVIMQQTYFRLLDFVSFFR